MSYRSIKRVLGETNLERKCRILFGICLLLLISGAFYWVDTVAEKLVIETQRSQGHDLVTIALLQAHFDVMDPQRQKMDADFANFVSVMSEDLKVKDYQSEILTLNTEAIIDQITAITPSDEAEIRILQELQKDVEQEQVRKISEQETTAGDGNLANEAARLALVDTPIFRDRIVAGGGNEQYHYFAPIRWYASCRSCHTTPFEAGALSAFESGNVYGADRPLHVVKVVFPFQDTRAAINKTRAILIAVAILTVFVAMVGLYVIVRYVIVKPLKHLRDTSDDISRGKTELRAELNTGDEFEELANSFNRMLRHLTDTQAELRQVNSDLDSKVDELAQLNMRLHEMNQLKGEFLANMSHELRTPLNSIIGFSEVLQGIDRLNDKQKRYAQNIQQSGRVLLEMINDILDLAKMEAGKMEVRPTEFELDKVVNAHCDMIRSLSEEKNIDLDVMCEPGCPPLYHDQTKVQRILTNLLSNAIKFTPEGGRISVTARRDSQERLELVVADTGVGIAEEDREIIFEKFRQGPALLGDDNLTREYSGTGLGLSIVKELCRLLGGEVSLDSDLGKGSTFRVVLPWVCVEQPRRTVELNSKIDALSMPQRGEFEQDTAREGRPAAITETATSVTDPPARVWQDDTVTR